MVNSLVMDCAGACSAWNLAVSCCRLSPACVIVTPIMTALSIDIMIDVVSVGVSSQGKTEHFIRYSIIAKTFVPTANFTQSHWLWYCSIIDLCQHGEKESGLPTTSWQVQVQWSLCMRLCSQSIWDFICTNKSIQQSPKRHYQSEELESITCWACSSTCRGCLT